MTGELTGWCAYTEGLCQAVCEQNNWLSKKAFHIGKNLACATTISRVPIDGTTPKPETGQPQGLLGINYEDFVGWVNAKKKVGWALRPYLPN